jgi:nucleoside-diphosphate-sugar epimerase
VYGNEANGNPHNGTITEDTLPFPTELYARSKLAGEDFIRRTIGLDFKIARIATLLGPGMRPALFNYIALDSVRKGRLITIHGNGQQTRTYGYITDVVDGLFAIWERGRSGEIYNVAGRDEVSVTETVWMAEKVVGKKAVYAYGPDRPGQILREKVSSDKLRSLGWEPKHTYEDAMRKSYEWMERGRP